MILLRSMLIALTIASLPALAAPELIQSKNAKVEGVRLHYLEAGHGDAVILLHGYTQTSRMWRKIMPRLAERFRVIAPDLPSIGESSVPKDGTDTPSAARSIHALATALGIRKASVVGHDIGLMVAYAYATQFPAEVSRLALLDAFLPGVPGWELHYNDPHLWHFRFNGQTPAALVRGRERLYFDYYWNSFAADPKRSLPEADRKAYVAAYARPGRLQASWSYFASWPELAKQFATLSGTRLEMPVLSMGGEGSMGALLGEQTRRVASNVTVVVLPGTGHWLMEERPWQAEEALIHFLSP